MKRIKELLLGATLAWAAITSIADTRYVNVNNPAPAAPHTNWASAARTIQEAVDASVNGDTIVVTNGLYATGGRAVYGTMTNRVTINKAVSVRSVNGPLVTLIAGSEADGTPNTGDGAIRCVYLGANALLSGFTLTNGHTRSARNVEENSGGGALCHPSGVLTNCTLVGNSAEYRGGGTYSGTLNNCTLISNSASDSGGGAYSGTLNHCTLTGNSTTFGGGAAYGTLTDCTLTSNSASQEGGGAYWSTLNRCTLTGNSANLGGGDNHGVLTYCTLTGNSAGVGGGTWRGTLNHCTLTGNSASFSGGGCCGGALTNCIVYYNSAPDGNYSLSDQISGSSLMSFCCTTPLPPRGSGNFSAEPRLASASHLSGESPCRGTGSAAAVTGLDIDGESWTNPPSIGCDEYWPGSVTGALSAGILIDYTNVVAGFCAKLQPDIAGRLSGSAWDFGDGTVVSNRPYVSHAWATPGNYAVVLRVWNESWPAGVVATVTVQVVSQPVHCVALSGASPLAPYSSWASAATNIQDAVDAATVPGTLVLVSNGVYQSGARAVDGMSNRVVVAKAIIIRLCSRICG